MRTRTYIKKGVWHLGRGRRSQRSGFLPLLVKPLLSTIARVAGLLVLNFLGKKIFRGR